MGCRAQAKSAATFVALALARHYPCTMTDASVTPAGPSRRLLFDAELFPHRSLPIGAFRLLIGLFAAICVAVGFAFYLVGAWPVIGFLGLDVLLLYAAFKLNYRQARLRERLQLSEDTLLVRRIDPARRERVWRFQPYWLRVIMPDPDRSDSQLILASHGRQVTIGAFLPPDERFAVAAALRSALAALKDPHARKSR